MGRAALRPLRQEFAEFLMEVLGVAALSDGTMVKAREAELAHGLPVALTPDEAKVLHEIQRAFYAGAAAVYAQVTFGFGDDTIDQAEVEAHLAALSEELQAMARDEASHI